MKNVLFLFDVDGTLVESGQKITPTMSKILHQLNHKVEIGIVGGGKLDKVLQQFGNSVYFRHYFTECGCVYSKNQSPDELKLEEIFCKNIRQHTLYPKINILVKEALRFLSQVEYTLTGNFIDLRNGIIYISLIGMSANISERKYFLEQDKKHKYKKQLIELLQDKAKQLNILTLLDIVEGGTVGIALYPKEYDKVQVIKYVRDTYTEIHYFGDKYRKNGNDYNLINHPNIVGHCVDDPSDTKRLIDAYLASYGS